MKYFILILVLCLHTEAITQVISGKITDSKGNPLAGANIFIENTYEGTSSHMDGYYSFQPSIIGNQYLVVSYIGYNNFRKELEIRKDSIYLDIILKESSNSLNAVVITAGSFHAGDK